MNINFGETASTAVIDDTGSTMTLFAKYYRGEQQLPAKVKFEIRVRIFDGSEQSAIAEAITELLSDPRVIESSVDVLHPPEGKGKYFEIIKKFTVLRKGRFVFDE